MSRKPKFRPEIRRIRLNPEQAVLFCVCYSGSRRWSATLNLSDISNPNGHPFLCNPHGRAGSSHHGACGAIGHAGGGMVPAASSAIS